MTKRERSNICLSCSPKLCLPAVKKTKHQKKKYLPLRISLGLYKVKVFNWDQNRHDQVPFRNTSLYALFAWHPTVNSFSHIFITKSLDSRCLCMCELFFFSSLYLPDQTWLAKDTWGDLKHPSEHEKSLKVGQIVYYLCTYVI